MKTYRLLRDLPDSNAGALYIYVPEQEAYYRNGDINDSYWLKASVEHQPEWFQEVITGLIGVNIQGNVIKSYQASASINIGEDGKIKAIGIDGKIFVPVENV